MRACHLHVLCIILAVVIAIHTLRGLYVLRIFIANEIASGSAKSASVVQSRVSARSLIKIVLDVCGAAFCFLFWFAALLVRLRPKDLTENHYRIYYMVSTITWQLVIMPYIAVSLLHSGYVAITLLDDAGFFHGEIANRLHDAFKGLSSDITESEMRQLLNWLNYAQRKFSCCGGTSYMNWLTLDMEMPPQLTVSDSDTQKPVADFDPWEQRHVGGFYPTSCCDRNQTISCLTPMLTPSKELTTYYMRYETPVLKQDCITGIYEHLYLQLSGCMLIFSTVDILLHVFQTCTQMYAFHKTAPRYPCRIWANRLPPLQSLLTPPRFGSRKESTGSVVHRTGSITHVDGSITHKDGTVTFPDGKTLPCPEKLIHKSGSITLRSGSRLHRSGSQTHVDGSRTHRSGSVTYADGARMHRDRTITTGPGDSRDNCMVGERAQMFFGSTGYISTARLISACQGIHLFAQPSLLQQADLDNKALWMEDQMQIGWIAHGGGKHYCTVLPRLCLKKNRAAGPTETSEFRRFLRLHLPIVEAIIYTDGNAILEHEANSYYRSFGVSFIRGVLFLLFGYLAASLMYPVFLPSNLDSPILNAAYNWPLDQADRDKEDLKVATNIAAIHSQVSWQAGMLLYTCIMLGALASRRVRCLLILIIPIFGLACGHAYMANQMIHAALLGPVASSERNFVSTGATLQCLAEMSHNVSRDLHRSTQVFPLDDEITEQTADVIGVNDSDFRRPSPGLIEMSLELSRNVTDQFKYIREIVTPVGLLGDNQTKLAVAITQLFTDEVETKYLEVANKIVSSLSDPLSKQTSQLQDDGAKAGLSKYSLDLLQSAITKGSEFEGSTYRVSVLGCMLIKSTVMKQCHEKSAVVCNSLQSVVRNLAYEPVWFRQACSANTSMEAACPTDRLLKEAQNACHDVQQTLRLEYGVGAYSMHATDVLEGIVHQFDLKKENQTDEVVLSEPTPQWMIPSTSQKVTGTRQLKDTMYTIFYILVIITGLARLFLVGVLYQSHKYISGFLTDVDYDNVYAGSMFEMIDSKRLNEGRETLLPLKSMETGHIYWRTKFYTVDEIKRLVVNLLRAVVFGCILLLLYAVNANIYHIVMFFIDLSVGFYGMSMQIRQTRFIGTSAAINGDGIYKQLLTKFLQNINRLKDIDLNYDTTLCGPVAYRVGEELQNDFYHTWYLLLALVLFAPLLLRMRHIIASFFYPSRVRNRSVELYNSMLTRRRRHMTTCRNQIVHWVREGRLQEEAKRLSQPTFLATINPKLAKICGMDHKTCLICQDTITSGPEITVCTLDRAALCRQCVEVVLKKDVCVVCLDRNPKRLFKERRRIQRMENQVNVKL